MLSDLVFYLAAIVLFGPSAYVAAHLTLQAARLVYRVHVLRTSTRARILRRRRIERERSTRAFLRIAFDAADRYSPRPRQY